MNEISWPDNFPSIQAMYELLQKMVKASWRNENHISSDDIQRWLNNFSGIVYDKETEQRLALWLLCNYSFYNEDEINHLSYIVYKMLIHDLVIHYKIKDDDELIRVLDRVYFAAMGGASESGGLLLYYFRQQSKLSINKFYYPSALPKDDDGILVFVDDVTLSGDTANRFFKDNIAEMKYERAYYLTLFASQTAIDKIEEYDIKMIHSTVLGDRDRCFSEKSLIYSAFPSLRECSEKMVRAYGSRLNPEHPLGHKNGQYCFGMFYNTPNNTLPIFWSTKDWTPIFPRKEKKYGNKGDIELDRFI